MAEEGNNSGAERTEEPTPRRRQEDFEKGDAAVSQEAGIAMSLAVLLLATAWLLPGMGPRLIDTFRQGLSKLAMVDHLGHRLELQKGFVIEVLVGAALRIMWLVLPVAGISVTALVGINLLQVGPRFQLERLGFDLGKLDPRKGIKRVFSSQFFVSLAKALAKGLGIVFIAALALQDRPLELWLLSFGSIYRLPSYLQGIGLSVLFPVTFAMVVLALIDFGWTRYRKEEGLKMSKQEVKEDVKSDSGDPQVRQARRQRMRDLVLGQPLPERMKEATVVATNPTHYAVALRYWPGRDEAPVVIAKGKDFRATKIREIAAELAVPVVEDKPLARACTTWSAKGPAFRRSCFRRSLDFSRSSIAVVGVADGSG